ncbi:MAG: RNase adapter RapZ [Steroidobacteraceae bacterium]
MRLVLVSGLSGSGKSVALHMLEDLDFYCIDNIPAALLKPFIAHTVRSDESVYRRTAVGVDARNTEAEIATVPTLLDELKRAGIACELLFLTATDEALLRRFAETRRKHPLSRDGDSLHASIAAERKLLEPMINAADLIIDTSRMGIHELRQAIQQRIEQRQQSRMSILFQSFGFKHGIPGDSDFVFDARTLPNPYWETLLRPLTGRDAEVAQYLQSFPAVAKLTDAIEQFVEARIGEHQAANRRYLTVSVGCTGGQHRSVYIVEQLAARFAARWPNVGARHSGLPNAEVFLPKRRVAPGT